VGETLLPRTSPSRRTGRRPSCRSRRAPSRSGCWISLAARRPRSRPRRAAARRLSGHRTGKRIAYRGTRAGLRNLFWKRRRRHGRGGAADRESRRHANAIRRLAGRTLGCSTPSSGRRLSARAASGGCASTAIAHTQPLHSGDRGHERNAHPSPDGRWLAFERWPPADSRSTSSRSRRRPAPPGGRPTAASSRSGRRTGARSSIATARA
jgi:hypothetical protein